MDDQLAIFRAQHGYEWPNCSTADCGNKVCTWATDYYCASCSLQLLGPEEITRRYNETHPDTPWTEPFPPGGARVSAQDGE